MNLARIPILIAIIAGAGAALAWVALMMISTWQFPDPPRVTAEDIEDAIAGCIKITREAASGH